MGYGFDVAAVSMELVLCCDAEFQGFFFSTIRFCALLFANLQLRSGFDGADCGREWLLAAAA